MLVALADPVAQQVAREERVQVVLLDLRVVLVRLVLADLLVHQDQLVLLEAQVLQDLVAHKVQLVLQAHLDLLALLEVQGLLVLAVLLVLQVGLGQVDHQVPQVHLA